MLWTRVDINGTRTTVRDEPPAYDVEQRRVLLLPGGNVVDHFPPAAQQSMLRHMERMFYSFAGTAYAPSVHVMSYMDEDPGHVYMKNHYANKDSVSRAGTDIMQHYVLPMLTRADESKQRFFALPIEEIALRLSRLTCIGYCKGTVHLQEVVTALHKGIAQVHGDAAAREAMKSFAAISIANMGRTDAKAHASQFYFQAQNDGALIKLIGSMAPEGKTDEVVTACGYGAQAHSKVRVLNTGQRMQVKYHTPPVVRYVDTEAALDSKNPSIQRLSDEDFVGREYPLGHSLRGVLYGNEAMGQRLWNIAARAVMREPGQAMEAYLEAYRPALETYGKIRVSPEEGKARS